jgi:hypothetical protein
VGSFTATPTVSFTGTPSAPVERGDAPLVISDVAVAPNPVTDGRVRLRVRLEGDAQSLEVGIYTVALVRVVSMTREGSYLGGGAWNQVDVPLPSGSANGLYHLEVTALRGNKKSRPKLARLFVMAR